jgi:hypothetical protein
MQKTVQLVFYVLLALYFFGVAIPYLAIVLGILCLVMVALSL